MEFPQKVIQFQDCMYPDASQTVTVSPSPNLPKQAPVNQYITIQNVDHLTHATLIGTMFSLSQSSSTPAVVICKHIERRDRPSYHIIHCRAEEERQSYTNGEIPRGARKFL